MAFRVSRINHLWVLFALLSCLLVGRLFYLQIISGPKLTMQSLSSRIQEVPVEVARGEILDRNNIPMTNTAQHFSIVVFPDQLTNKREAADKLALMCGMESSRIYVKLSVDGFPVKLRTDIDAVTAQKINNLKLTGVLAVSEKVRYSYTSQASHLIGYINTADNRGVSGLEGMYDELLRGNQSEYVAAMVDATQQLIPGLGYKRLQLRGNSSGPHNVVLTIDSKIQKSVETIMDHHIDKGAVVVMRPSTGEILALASRPNFDANNLGEYLNNNAAPLLNRAVTAYQPGSVFKLVVAAAALENKVVRPNDVFFDPGYIDVNNLRFKGWDYDKGGRGKITFTDAIAHSSNPALIDVGLKLGANELITYARRLGFGHKTRLDFDGEADGNLPEPNGLYPGELANLSIGQGMLEATPLQLVSMVATIVNDGIKVDPCLVSRLTTADGTVVKNYSVSRGTRIFSRQTAIYLREMMAAATSYGTAQAAFVDGPGSAGKTGSAETGRVNKEGKSISHAWFAGYAPLDNPAYVVVVFVEEGMSGGDVAAPIFREIISSIMANKSS